MRQREIKNTSVLTLERKSHQAALEKIFISCEAVNWIERCHTWSNGPLL
jgi:hypothetical protein